jgi:hypothetical protein
MRNELECGYAKKEDRIYPYTTCYIILYGGVVVHLHSGTPQLTTF